MNQKFDMTKRMQNVVGRQNTSLLTPGALNLIDSIWADERTQHFYSKLFGKKKCSGRKKVKTTKIKM